MEPGGTAATIAGARAGRPLGLRRLIARAAARELTAFVVPGVEVARAFGLDLVAAGLRPAATPRHARVLLIVGELPDSLARAAAYVYAQMPRPRVILAAGSGELPWLPLPEVVTALDQQALTEGVRRMRALLAAGAFAPEAPSFAPPDAETLAAEPAAEMAHDHHAHMMHGGGAGHDAHAGHAEEPAPTAMPVEPAAEPMAHAAHTGHNHGGHEHQGGHAAHGGHDPGAHGGAANMPSSEPAPADAHAAHPSDHAASGHSEHGEHGAAGAEAPKTTPASPVQGHGAHASHDDHGGHAREPAADRAAAPEPANHCAHHPDHADVGQGDAPSEAVPVNAIPATIGHAAMGHGTPAEAMPSQPPAEGEAAMDHAGMDHAAPAHEAMNRPETDDPSSTQTASGTSGMDHAAMGHPTPDGGPMDHSSMGGQMPAAAGGGADHDTMDHAAMGHDMAGMDHGGMDHSAMGHGAMDHSTMDHTMMGHDMGGMDHSAHMMGGFMSMVAMTKDLPRSADGLPMEWLETPFGPLFPGLAGGLSLRLTLDGDGVAVAAIVPGAARRGLDAALLGPAAGFPDRLARFDPLAAASYRVLALRALAAVAPLPDAHRQHIEAGWVGAVERERAASHLGWLAALGEQLGVTWLAERAAARQLALVRATSAAEVAGLAPSVRDFTRAVERTPLLRRRLAGFGIVATDAGARGPVARGAGVLLDARAGDPAYAAMGFAPIVGHGGDALARLRVRLAEIDQSLALAERAGNLSAEAIPLSPHLSGMGMASVETPRGAASLHLELAHGQVTAAHVDPPSRAHASLVASITEGSELADALVGVASLDLSPWEIDG